MQFLIVANLRAGVIESGLPENFEQLLEKETAQARQGYLDGSLRQIWLQQPDPAAVAIVEAQSLEDAKRVAAAFPLVEAKLVDSHVIALAPYSGFGEP